MPYDAFKRLRKKAARRKFSRRRGLSNRRLHEGEALPRVGRRPAYPAGRSDHPKAELLHNNAVQSRSGTTRPPRGRRKKKLPAGLLRRTTPAAAAGRGLLEVDGAKIGGEERWIVLSPGRSPRCGSPAAIITATSHARAARLDSERDMPVKRRRDPVGIPAGWLEPFPRGPVARARRVSTQRCGSAGNTTWT